MRPGLQPVRADNLSVGLMFHQQMITYGVERIGVAPRGERFREALIEFDVEDFKAQFLRRAEFGGGLREAHGILPRLAGKQAGRFDM